MEYLFIFITPRSTLTWVVVPVRVPLMGEIDSFKNYSYLIRIFDAIEKQIIVLKLYLFTISYLKAYNCKLFVLRIVTWSSNCLLRIIIIISYLKAYNCKLFVLRIVTWSSNCLLRIIIIISYLKAYNCKLFVLRIVTWSSNCLLRIIIIS